MVGKTKQDRSSFFLFTSQVALKAKPGQSETRVSSFFCVSDIAKGIQPPGSSVFAGILARSWIRSGLAGVLTRCLSLWGASACYTTDLILKKFILNLHQRVKYTPTYVKETLKLHWWTPHTPTLAGSLKSRTKNSIWLLQGWQGSNCLCPLAAGTGNWAQELQCETGGNTTLPNTGWFD